MSTEPEVRMYERVETYARLIALNEDRVVSIAAELERYLDRQKVAPAKPELRAKIDACVNDLEHRRKRIAELMDEKDRLLKTELNIKVYAESEDEKSRHILRLIVRGNYPTTAQYLENLGWFKRS